MRLMGMQGTDRGDAVSEIARVIIDKFPAFKSFNIELFNKKASTVKFADIVRYVFLCVCIYIYIYIYMYYT